MENKKYVLIIGGLGSLGNALTPKLLGDGFSVLIADRKKSEDKSSADVSYYSMDVTSVSSILDFRRAIEVAGIKLSHIVNTVGELVESGLTDLFKTSAQEISDTIDLNLKGQLYVARYLGQHLAESDGDKSLTMISSINAHIGYSIPFYSASKGGLHGFLPAAAMDLGRHGIRVNVVTPGTVKTPVTEQQPKNFEARARASALGRLSSVNEVADGVLAAIKLTGMSGQELVIDCGQSINPSESLYDQRRDEKIKVPTSPGVLVPS